MPQSKWVQTHHEIATDVALHRSPDRGIAPDRWFGETEVSQKRNNPENTLMFLIVFFVSENGRFASPEIQTKETAVASSNYLTQAEASPDFEETTLHGLILESLDSIAGPLAIFAAGLTWCLAFDLTVPPPEPAPAVLVSASAPAPTDVLARQPENAMPDPTFQMASMIGAGFSVAHPRRPTDAPADPSLASVASLYAVSQTPAPSPHSLRTDRQYATAGLALARTTLLRP